MKIMLQNKYLVPSINFLQGLKLKGKDSRARSKLVKILMIANSELSDAEVELLEQCGVKDDEGNLVTDTDGNYKLIKEQQSEYHKEHGELMNEVAEIDGATYKGHKNDMLAVLGDYDEELDGIEAEAYNELFDALEKKEDK